MSKVCRNGCGWTRGTDLEAICMGCGGELEDAVEGSEGAGDHGDDADEAQGGGEPDLRVETIPIDEPSPELLTLDAPLARALGGLERAALVLVHGTRGAGKSTEFARLADELRRRGERIVWLDGEMSAPRYAAIFRRVGARTTVPRVGLGDWRAALALREVQAASVVFVDSLDAWAEHDAEDFRRGLQRLADRGALVLVLRHQNAKGQAMGARRHGHLCEAEAEVTPTEIIGGPKCRWAIAVTIPRPAVRVTAASAWDCLGVKPGDLTGARRAWRRLAQLDHPDKWATATPDEQQAAARRFAVLRAAWEHIQAAHASP